jgi:hypothetical protein
VSYSWILPGSSSPPTSTPEPSTGPSTASAAILGGVYDQEIDPVSLDFIDTDDGAWSETQDSRSIVMCQLDIELGSSYSFPGDGTDIRRRLESGDPLTPSIVIADIRRAMGVLASVGVLTLLDVQGVDADGDQLVDEVNRPIFLLSWIDLATGSPVDAVYRPNGA